MPRIMCGSTMNQLEEEYAMRRKKFFACASAIWAVLLVALMATSAMAVTQTSRSEEMIANSTCDFAGSTTYVFTEDDYNIIVAYLAAGNQYVRIRAALNGDNIDPASDVPVLCEPITNPLFDGTDMGAQGPLYVFGAVAGSGDDLPDDLVALDTLGVEVSDMSDDDGTAVADNIGDVTAYAYGADGNQVINIYITHIQPASNWTDANTFPWIKIGLHDEVAADAALAVTQHDGWDPLADAETNGTGAGPADGLPDPGVGLADDDYISTAICADVHDFGGLSKLTLSTDFEPVTLTVTGSDNEIGHFIAQAPFTLDECGDTKGAVEYCVVPTTEVELCPVVAQGCYDTNYYCFTVESAEWPDAGLIDINLRLNGAADGANTQTGVYFHNVTVKDESDASMMALPDTDVVAHALSTAGADIALIDWDDCDELVARVLVVTIEASDIRLNGAANNQIRVCVEYIVDSELASEGDDVFLWTDAGVQPCGNLWSNQQRTMASLVECGGLGDNMYFQYVLTDTAPWGAGIAMVNLGYDGTNGIPPADMEAVVTVTDSAGSQCTMTKDDFTTTTWNFMMDDIVGDLSCTPAAGAAWVDFSTNFEVDGWLFFTDGNGFAGTSARLNGPTDVGQ